MKSIPEDRILEKGLTWWRLKIFRYARNRDYLVLFVINLTMSAILGMLQPIAMSVFARSISRIIQGALSNSLIGVHFDVSAEISKAFKGLGPIVISSFFLAFITNFLYEYYADLQVIAAKKRYTRDLFRQEIGYFDSVNTGDITSTIDNAASAMRIILGSKFSSLPKQSFIFIGAYLISFYFEPFMSLSMMISLPIMILSAIFSYRLIVSVQTNSSFEYKKSINFAEESFRLIRTVVSFCLERTFVGKFNNSVNEGEKIEKKNLISIGIFAGILSGSIVLSYFFGWLYGAFYIRNALRSITPGDVTFNLGNILVVFLALLIGSFALNNITQLVDDISKSSSVLKPLKQLADQKSNIDPLSDEGVIVKKNLNGVIRFENIKFKYLTRPDSLVFNGLSFEIKENEKIALIGPSGCGKSTIIQLLQRYYNLDSGKIYVDDIDICTWNVQDYRSIISVVAQEPRLFNTTIRENIMCGKASATEEDMIEAAKLANAYDFIMKLPQKFDTNVGIGGASLSGGQKQRVAIARAIIRKPKILILDEATSALDTKSEETVQNALTELLTKVKITTITIAHRLSTIKNSDRILMFKFDNDLGYTRIIEAGSHEELMNIENGLYKAAFEAQNLRNVSDNNNSENSQEKDNSELVSIPVNHRDSSLDIRRSTLTRKLSFCEFNLDEPPVVQLKHSKKRLLKEQLKFKYMLITLIISEAINGITQPAVGVMFGIILKGLNGIDFVQNDPISVSNIVFKRILILAFMYLVLSVIYGFSSYFAVFYGKFIGISITNDLKKRVYENTIHQEISFFDDKKYSPTILSSVLSYDCNNIIALVGPGFGLYIKSILTLLGSFILAATFNLKVAAAGFAIYVLILPLFFFQNQIINNITNYFEKKYFSNDSSNFVFDEIISNVRIIATFNLQSNFFEKYDKALQAELKRNIYVNLGSSFIVALCESLSYLALLIIYVIGLFEIKVDIARFGQIMIVVLSIFFASNALMRSSADFGDLSRISVGLKNIFYFENRKSKCDIRDEKGYSVKVENHIKAQNVKFRYMTRPESAVLKNISFTVNCKESAAFVGETGCGKSTIIQLLERFYDILPVKNAVYTEQENRLIDKCFNGGLYIDDININEVNVRSLREAISLVSQEPNLFNATIYENIKFGKSDATDEEIYKAAQLSQIHDFILTLPEKYQTNVGQYGFMMSGGQKQRIAIARAIIKNPKILLLDEATSALDPMSEKQVQLAINQIIKESNLTTISIAHRLSTIKDCNKIFVFHADSSKNGSVIVEEGTHDQLVRINHGYYRTLANFDHV